MRVALAADGGGDHGLEVETTADPVDPAEAIDWFRDRVIVPRARWDELDAQARQRAFMVSGVASLDVVTHVWTALDRAVAEGTDFREFQRAVGAELEAAWGAPNAGRLETVFRTNVQAAYAAGRYAQLTSPDVLALRPFWQFDAVLDSRTSKVCRPLDELVHRADDAFWRDHYPPLHFNCRSSVVSLDDDQAAAAGGVAAGIGHDAQAPTDGFGGPPDLNGWQPDLSATPHELLAAFHARTATADPTP